MKPTLFPLLPLPGEVPPVPVPRCKGCRPPKARCERPAQTELPTETNARAGHPHHILGDVVRVVFVSVCDDRSRGVHFNTVELEPTSSLEIHGGRWPTSMTRPSRLAVEKPLAVMTRV